MPDGFDPMAIMQQAAAGKLPSPQQTVGGFPTFQAYGHTYRTEGGNSTGVNSEDQAAFLSQSAPSWEGKVGFDQSSGASQSPPDQASEPAPFDPMALMGQAAKGQLKYTPPEPKPGMGTWPGVAKNAAAGLAEGGWNALAAPANLANTLANLPIKGINAVAGTHIPEFSTDLGGDASRALANATGGFSPTETPATGWAEKAARVGGEAVATLPQMALGGAGLAAAPVGRMAQGVGQAMASAPVGAAAAPVIGGAMAGQAASDAVPPAYKPYADLAGNVLGGGALAVGQAATGGAARFAGKQLGSMGIGAKQNIGGEGVTNTQADLAAQQIQDALGPQGRHMLFNAPEQIVPGDQPTVAQMAPTGGAVALEGAARDANQAPFLERQQQQNNARVAAIQGTQPTGNAGAVAPELARVGDTLDQAGRVATEGQRQHVAGVSDALGGRGSSQDYSAAMRDALATAEKQGKDAASRLWAAVDPEGTLALDVSPVKKAATSLLGEINPGLGDNLNAQESGILSGVGSLPDVVPFRQLQRLRTNIGSAERAIRAAPGNDQSLRRLAILKSAVDQSMSEAAGRAAEQDPVLAERLRSALGDVGQQTEAGAGQNAASGVGVGGRENAGPPAGGGGRVSGTAVPQGSGLGGASRDQGVARGTTPDDLLSFLTRKGGVQDLGGDLAASGGGAYHHQAGGRLINPRGLPLDRAREAAEEAGFLPPGSDINDLKNAISEGLTGRKVFRPEEETAGNARRQTNSEQNMESVAYDRARADVLRVEEDHGVRASPDEIEHATRLTMQGAHPEDALRQAAAAAEERAAQNMAQRGAFGRPGVPAGEQRELPGTARAQVTENFDQAAADRYAAARNATRENKQTFRTGRVGDVLQGGQQGAAYRVVDADLARRFFSGQPREASDVAAYIAAVGGRPEALDAARNFLVSDLREKGIIQADGTLKPEPFARWQAQRGRSIDLFPELKPQFAKLADAQRILDETVATHEQAVKAFQTGVAKDFLKGDDPLVAVRKAFGTGNPPETFAQLTRLVAGNPDAAAGLKRAVTEFILDKFSSTAPAGASDIDFLKADGFQRFLRTNKRALRTIYGGQGVQNLEAVGAALRRAAQRTAVTPGSPTHQKFSNAAKHGFGLQQGIHLTALTMIGEQLGEILAHVGGEHELVGKLVGAGIGAGTYLVHALKQSGIKTTQDLITQAMLHPDVARELLQRVPANGKIGPVWQRRIAANLLATLASDQTRKAEDKPQ
jgi:hypothetical protein